MSLMGLRIPLPLHLPSPPKNLKKQKKLSKKNVKTKTAETKLVKRVHFNVIRFQFNKLNMKKIRKEKSVISNFVSMINSGTRTKYVESCENPDKTLRSIHKKTISSLNMEVLPHLTSSHEFSLISNLYTVWFAFSCLMAYYPLWVISYQSHPCKRTVVVLFNQQLVIWSVRSFPKEF